MDFIKILPNEVNDEIFAHIPPQVLWLFVRPVSKLWKDCSRYAFLKLLKNEGKIHIKYWYWPGTYFGSRNKYEENYKTLIDDDQIEFIFDFYVFPYDNNFKKDDPRFWFDIESFFWSKLIDGPYNQYPLNLDLKKFGAYHTYKSRTSIPLLNTQWYIDEWCSIISDESDLEGTDECSSITSEESDPEDADECSSIISNEIMKSEESTIDNLGVITTYSEYDDGTLNIKSVKMSLNEYLAWGGVLRISPKCFMTKQQRISGKVG